MIAAAVAEPVRTWLSEEHARGVLLGAGPWGAHIGMGEWVLSVSAPDMPLMPNGIRLARPAGRTRDPTARRVRWPRLGAHVHVSNGAIGLPRDTIAFGETPTWNPSVPVSAPDARPRIARRGGAILARLRGRDALDHQARAGSRLLCRSLRERDPALARDANLLVGRGPGRSGERGRGHS